MIARSVRAVLAVALTLSIASCSSSGGATDSKKDSHTAPSLNPNQRVAISWETYTLLQKGAWSDTINALVKKFEAEHPNITVTAQAPAGAGVANALRSVQQETVAGHPPDVDQVTFDGLDYAANSLGAQNYDSLYGADQMSALFGGTHPFPNAVRELGKVSGKTYSVPFVLSTPVLFYNQKLLTAAGITTAPTTWEAAKSAAQAVKAKAGADGIYVDCFTKISGDWCYNSLLYSNGGAILDNGKLAFGQTPAVEATAMGADLVSSGASPNLTQTQALTAFSSGKMAMILESSAVQATFQKGAKTNGWTLGAAAEPSFGSIPAVPTNSGAGLMIFAKDQAKQAAAFELVKFLTSDEAYKTITPQIGYLPLRTGLVSDPYGLKQWAADNPLIKPNLDQLSRIRPWSSIPGDNYLEATDTMMGAVESVVYNGQPAESTLKSAQDKANKLLADG